MPLFRNIAFTIAEGDRIGLIGPNGSGKSTLLQILSGTTEADSGEVALRLDISQGYQPLDLLPQPAIDGQTGSLADAIEFRVTRANRS